jgi:hypothetical protein
MMRLLLLGFGAVATLSAATPVRVLSYGPNGSHWPSLIPTPFMYDTATLNIEVDCSWSAIQTALRQVTAAQAAAGVRITVRPGTLVGLGASLGSTSVIIDSGSSAWTQRVTVCPRDGYGSVKIQNGFKLTRVKGVCFAGFHVGGFYWIDCDRSALAWTRVDGYSAIHSQASGGLVTKIELSEVVWPDAQTSNADVLQVIANSGNFTGYRFDGLWMAPHYYVDNTDPRPHTDTLQIYAAGGASYNNINLTLRDSVIFASNNAAFQTGGSRVLTMDRLVVIGGALGKTVYPVTPGGETSELFCAINGAGSDWTVTNSYLYGPMILSNPNGAYSNNPFKTVNGSTLSEVVAGLVVPLSGTWTRSTNTTDYLSKLRPNPTPAFLDSIWGPNQVPPGTGDTGTALLWQNYPFAGLSQRLRASLDLRLLTGPTHTVAGLSGAAAAAFTDLAVAVRFSDTGVVEARSGSVFKADAVLTHVLNKTYRIDLDVDVPGKKYSAVVTPEGGSPVVIATDYAFRAEQATIATLANLAAKAETGSYQVSGIVVTGLNPPSPPSGLRIQP